MEWTDDFSRARLYLRACDDKNSMRNVVGKRSHKVDIIKVGVFR